MVYDSNTYSINVDKLTITKSTKNGEQDERMIQFTCLVGVNV